MATNSTSDHPRATRRVGSEDHSDHEPGYSAACTPVEASAASTTDAVTPDPQYTPADVSTPSNSRVRSASGRNRICVASSSLAAVGQATGTGSSAQAAPDLLLARHDYRVDVAGGFQAVQYVSELTDADGILVPTNPCRNSADLRLTNRLLLIVTDDP
jgi:hypothetical protein